MTLACFLLLIGNVQAQRINNDTEEEWLKDLYDEGVTIKNDSLYISKEALKVYSDEAYRQSMYPKAYDWQTAIDFIQKRELKRAFWFLMNLYTTNTENKPLVIKTFVTYNSYLEMNKILTATFYTYCYADPMVSNMVNGKPEIHSPHILEEKLLVLKELLFYLDKYKSESEKVFTIKQTE